MKFVARVVGGIALGLGCLSGAQPVQALQIQAVFDPSITNDPNSAAIMASINSVIAMFRFRFSDNVVAKIYFQKGGGLGGSFWGYYWYPSGVAVNALRADRFLGQGAQSAAGDSPKGVANHLDDSPTRGTTRVLGVTAIEFAR